MYAAEGVSTVANIWHQTGSAKATITEAADDHGHQLVSQSNACLRKLQATLCASKIWRPDGVKEPVRRVR